VYNNNVKMISSYNNILKGRERIVIFLLHFMWFYITRSTCSYPFHITPNWNRNQIVFYMYLFFMITIEEPPWLETLRNRNISFRNMEIASGCVIRVQLINKKFYWIHPSWYKLFDAYFCAPSPRVYTYFIICNVPLPRA